ncbi:hypothetical protein ADIS_3713 [Lunatimonas lonarensis]|uniref:histidine kinase n=2 Tax=Lunatimonas lonarensis TaxID=1232681 RepID=R7ZP11_9BACT|nr:hypothetical protein ADIS_3713 [Lunatimonas lonarensis]
MLATLEDLTKSGTWKLCLNSNSIEWSAGVFSMLGYEPDEFHLNVESAVDVIHPEDRDRAINHMQLAIREKKPYNIRMRLIGKGGRICQVVSKATMIRGEDGSPKSLIGIFQDITEFIEHKKELKSILNSSLDIICSVDLQHRFLKVNSASFDILGYYPEELEGQAYSDFLNPNSIEKSNQFWAQLFQLKKVKNFENSLRHRDGHFVPISWTAHYEENSEVIYCVGRDITDRLQAESDNERNERRYKSMIQEGGDFVAIISPSGKFTYVSPTYNRILNYPEEELLGSFVYLYIHPEDKAKLKHESSNILPGQRCITSPYRFRSNSGQWRWIRTTLVNLSQDESIKGFVANSNDITDIVETSRKLAESEGRFRGLYESQTNYIIRTDLEGRYTYVNKKFREEFGWIYQNAAIIGEFCLRSICEYHRQRVADTVEKCIHNPEVVFKVEIDKPTISGGVMSTLWDFICVVDEIGQPREIQCIGVDITERVKSERSLIASNERFELINKATSDAIYDWDIKNDTFHWGEAYFRIFGYENHQAPHSIQAWETLQHPQDTKNNKEEWTKYMEDPSRFKWQEIFRWRKGDGNYAYVEEIGYLVRDESGNPIRMVGVLRDISGSKTIEIANALQQTISSFFKSDKSIKEVLFSTVELISKELAFSKAEIWLKSEDNDTISLNAGYAEISLDPEEDSPCSNQKLKHGEGIPGLVWVNQQTYVWDDLGTNPDFKIRSTKPAGAHQCCLALPITTNGLFVGTLIVYSQEPLLDVQYQLEILENLASYLGGEILRKLQEEQMRLLFEWSPDILAIASPKGYFTKVNPAFCQLLGYEEQEILLRPFTEFLHPEDLASTSLEFEETSSGIRQAENFVNRYRTAFGNYKYISWGSSTPFGDDGFLFSYGKDVTPVYELQRMLQAASEMAKVGAWELDLIKGTHKWSAMTREIFEVPASFDPEVATVIDFYPADFRPFVRAQLDRAITMGEPFEFEAIITTPKGSEKWVKIKGEAEIADGRPVRVYGSVQDIHQHKTDQQAIQQALNERNNILESIGEAFFSVDKNWKTLYWNKSAEKLLHVPRGQVMEKIVWDAVPELVGHGLKSACQSALETNAPMQLESHDKETDRWLEVGIYPKWDQIGVFIRDIGNRKKAQQELLQSNERFQKIAEATNDAIWDFNVPKNHLFWGKGFEKLFGYNLHSISPSLEFLMSLIHPDDRQAVFDKIQDYMRPTHSENNWTEEYRFRRADGSFAYVIDRAIFIRNPFGVVVRVLGAMTDITHQKNHENSLRKLNEQLKSKVHELAISNQELEQFAYVASHDLQEPLRMITGFLGQIVRKYDHVLDEKGKQYIGFAVDGATRMRRIILDLLEYSRVGREEEQVESVDLTEIVNETKLLFRKTLDETGAEVTYENLSTIVGRWVPMRQVFQNLISNALKYRSPERTPKIHVRGEEQLENYVISIQDNGIGIDQTYFDKIFIIFQRLHSEPSVPGTGMGLAITKKIIENYGGTIWLESIPNEGSTFYFTVKKAL